MKSLVKKFSGKTLWLLDWDDTMSHANIKSQGKLPNEVNTEYYNSQFVNFYERSSRRCWGISKIQREK